MQADSYIQTVKQLLETYGQDGQLQCAPATAYVYDPLTGETTNDGPLQSVRFAMAHVSTTKDIDPHRRALQRDAGLDVFKEGTILFQVPEDSSCEPTESAYLLYAGDQYNLTALTAVVVNGKVVAYKALYNKVAL